MSAIEINTCIIANPNGPYKQIIDIFPVLVLIGKQRSSLRGQMEDLPAASGAC
jgi:hypothetical protein